MNPVTLTHLLAQARTAEIVRAAERAALSAPAPRSADQARRAGLGHWWTPAIRPASATSPRSPVPCCA